MAWRRFRVTAALHWEQCRAAVILPKQQSVSENTMKAKVTYKNRKSTKINSMLSGQPGVSSMISTYWNYRNTGMHPNQALKLAQSEAYAMTFGVQPSAYCYK